MDRYMTPRNVDRTFWLLFMILLIASFFGCNTAKIGQKAVEDYKASSKYPEDCGKDFPNKVIEGETTTDTADNGEIDCDEIVRRYAQFWEGVSTENEKERKALADTIAAMIARGQKPPSKVVKCPPSVFSLRVDTLIDRKAEEAAIRKRNEIQLAYTADTARRNQKELQQAAKIKTRTKQRNSSLIANGVLSAILLAGLYLRFKKKKIMT